MAFELANGHGTTRLTLEQILDRERERNAPEDQTVQRRRAASEIGVLSRTLTPSSMTKWIIPARLTGDMSMQLLFVGENHIHIKEVIPDVQVDFRLRHRKTIPFISDQIRAVALIGQPTNSELFRNDTPLPNIYEAMAKAHLSSQERRDFPMQIIALTLSSGFLQLLTPYLRSDEEDEYLKFRSKLVPFPDPESHALLPGAGIAVDPFSRAFAVTAAFDSVIVYNNHDSLQFATRIASDENDWNPIRQERIFPILGCIVGVEFLNPGTDTDDVVMIVVSAVGRSSTLSCYVWRHQDGPRYRKVVEHQPLSLEPGSLCNMIIPMAHSPDFLLVHGATVNLYTEILTGSPRVLNVVNKKSNWETEPAHPASSKRRPHFTAWCRPERVPGHKGEFIYLIREDGAIRHFQRVRGHVAGVIGNTGDFGCHVSSAVTCFCPMRSAPDYLIAAGDMSPGELYSVGVNLKARGLPEVLDRDTQMSLIKQATLPDWAPVMDIQIVHNDGSHRPPSILATSGRQPFGAISELRVGCEAQISSVADLSQLDESLVGANGMWALRDARSGDIHYICSYPGQTTAVCVSNDGHLETSTLQLEADLSTVLAAVTPGDTIMLVNESGISLQRLLSAEEMEVEPSTLKIPSEYPIIAASYHNNIIVEATRKSSDVSGLLLYDFPLGITQTVPARHNLDIKSEITAISTFSHQADTFAIVSMREQGLVLYGTTNGTLHEHTRTSLEGSIAQTIQVFPREQNGGNDLAYSVICGLRDGRLGYIELHIPLSVDGMEETSDINKFSGPVFHSIRYFRMGHGPVQVFPDVKALRRGFVLCDSETVVVEIGDEASALHFTSVYFTDETDTSFRQSPLAAILALPSSHNENISRDYDTTLACHDGQNLIFARLLSGQKTIPRRLPLKKYQNSFDIDLPSKDISGTPTKLLYSGKLDATIVAGVKYEHRPKGKVPEPAWQGKRLTRAFLTVIPSSANHVLDPNQESWNEMATQIDFAPSERVLSLCEWRFEREGKTYHYLLVGTSIQKGEVAMIEGRRQGVKKGRLWFLAPKKSEDGTIRLDLKSIKDVNRPVRALAVLDESKVVVAPDGALNIYTFSAENKWTHVCNVQLPSQAVHITTNSPRIFVTTTRNSVLGYELKQMNAPGSESSSLEQLFADDMPRNGITHIDLEIQPSDLSLQSTFPTASQSQQAKDDRKLNILLGSDKDGQVFGLEIPRYRTYQSVIPTMFELQVPQCVTKFSRGPMRAPWYERQQPAVGILEDDILGAATDGTIFHFTLLTNEARLLLKFLENLVRWNETENKIQMLHLEHQQGEDLGSNIAIGDEYDDDVVSWPLQNTIIDPEFIPGAAGQRVRRNQYGINGDFLAPFLGDGAVTRMHTLLNREGSRTRHEESKYLGNQPEARWKKFVDLVDRVLGSHSTGRRGDTAAAVVECVAWLSEVMRPVL